MVKSKTRKPEVLGTVIDPLNIRDEAIRAIRIIIARPSLAEPLDRQPSPRPRKLSPFRISL
jgi:hypothetical protein